MFGRYHARDVAPNSSKKPAGFLRLSTMRCRCGAFARLALRAELVVETHLVTPLGRGAGESRIRRRRRTHAAAPRARSAHRPQAARGKRVTRRSVRYPISDGGLL